MLFLDLLKNKFIGGILYEKIFNYYIKFWLIYYRMWQRKKVLEINQIEVKNDLIYEKKSIRPFTGKVISKYDNGSLFSEYNYINGRLNGFFKEYYENGQLLSEGNYKDDELEGILRYYYENGQLLSEGNYKDDELEGILKYYYENGQLEREENYKNGNRDGLLKEYSEAGELKAEKYFKPIKLIDDEKMF
ncbi:toxin-antitoxin system YwqK family antitoxin [Fusobacterium varium]|uniref:toxin-antitoxin system YwqK family antitoxin n=1 Tax=Fusobacterium varium TaxID=856 RepID=UPI002FE43C84